MPTKKNFLGGQQNYNERTGEYESRLVKADGTGATKANMPGGTDGKGNPQPKADKTKGTAKGISGVAPENRAGAENVNGYQVFEKNGKWHAMDGKGYISPAGGYGSKDEAVNAAKAYNQGADLKGRKAPKEKDEAKYTKTEWGSQFSEDGRSAITSKGHRIEKGMQLPSGDYVTGFDPDTNTIFIDEDPGVEGGRDYDIEDLDDEIARAEEQRNEGPRVSRDKRGTEYHFEDGNTFIKTKSGRTVKLDEKLGGNFKGLYATGFDPESGTIMFGTKPGLQDAGDYDIGDFDHDIGVKELGKPVKKNEYSKEFDQKEQHTLHIPSHMADDIPFDKLESMGVKYELDNRGTYRFTGPEAALTRIMQSDYETQDSEGYGDENQTDPLDPDNLQKLFDKHGGDEDAVTEELRKKSLDIDDGDLQGVVEAFAMGYNRKRR